MTYDRFVARSLEVILAFAPAAIFYRALAANSNFDNPDRTLITCAAIPIGIACLGLATGIHMYLRHRPQNP